MDEIARVCEWAKGRFTGIWTDISKVEMELGKARDWSSQAQDQIDWALDEIVGLEVLVQCLDSSQRVMRLEMDEMIGNMNGLLELNWQMIQSICQLRAGQVHGQDNLIVIDDKPPVDVLDTAPVPVPGPVVHELVPIEELTESVGDSEEDSSKDEVWEISQEEFIGLSPEL